MRKHSNKLNFYDAKGKVSKTLCQIFKYCSECCSIVKRCEYYGGKWRNHDCSQIYCSYCHKLQKKPHYHYMKCVDVVQTESVCDKLFFFDFEIRSDGDGLCFDVYYCVVNVVCKKCKDVPFDSDGSDVQRYCGCRVEIFSGDECIDQFCEYMIEMDKKCKSIWMAHNGARFDTLFIRRWMLSKFNIIVRVVMNGNKILNITVLDSYLFFGNSLKKLPKILNIDVECEKGFHPYFFFDLNYVGPIVDKKYFDISCMDNDERMKFQEWYESKRDKEYNFENEVKTYCCNDVKILRLCCIEFYNLCKTTCCVEPFFDASLITIASMAENFSIFIYETKYYWSYTQSWL